MRLFYFSKGHPVLLEFSMHSAVSTAEIKDRLLRHGARFLREDGFVHNLFIDFEGEHVVVHHEKELDVVCRLMAAYQNNLIRQGLQVRFVS
tara:strand:+ start:6298 stop:6570 length:273 start_codon:yes stop_codon:yes gene_type:complete